MGCDPTRLVDFPIPKDRTPKCSTNSGDGTSLVLTLGQSSNCCISIPQNNTNDEYSVNLEGTVSQRNIFSYLSKPELNLELSLSTTSYAEADTSFYSQELCSFPLLTDKNHLNHEGTISSKRKIGPLVPPLPTQHIGHHTISTPPFDLSLSSLFDTSGVAQNKSRKRAAVKICLIEGCTTGARGATGRCILHGGGKRCKIEGCKSSAEGKTVNCIAHGGGRRCQHSGCKKGAQGRTMLCKAHGGGIRCTFPRCQLSAAEGRKRLCKGHGGGKRCTHGEGCTSSVHGKTLFCVRHGGGKRCATPGCEKGARSSTSHCVRHGGGNRCKHGGCVNSAQGIDFCKSHGGGKRCAWGHLGSEFGDLTSAPCDKYARGRSGLCSSHNALVGSAENAPQTPQADLEERVHGGNYFQTAIFGNNYD